MLPENNTYGDWPRSGTGVFLATDMVSSWPLLLQARLISWKRVAMTCPIQHSAWHGFLRVQFI